MRQSRIHSIEQSPFPYQGPLQPEEVQGRLDLQRDLAERLLQRRVTALLGPRRYGKTSVLRRVVHDLEGVGPEAVWLDFYGMSTIADVAGALDRGLAASRGRVRGVLDSVAGGLSINLGVLGVELSRSKRDRPDPTATLWSLLEVLVRTAERHELVVVADEFSGLAGAEGAAAILRSALQNHYRDMGLVFAGSEPAGMKMLFTEPSSPFFAQADLLEIGPLQNVEVADLVAGGFAATGRDAGSVVGRIVAMGDGHPQRCMQLADAVWRLTDPGSTATQQIWEEALVSVRRSVDSGSERMYSLLPPGHRKTLRVLASGGSIYGTAADVVDLAPGTARAALDALSGSGFLREVAGRHEVVDPLLADWLRRRFPL